jgi:putative endonuclease
MVLCSDGTLYTGYTTDLVRRINTHNKGRGAKYTRGRLPVFLVYSEEFPTKSEALRRELEIKKLSRKEKEILIVL